VKESDAFLPTVSRRRGKEENKTKQYHNRCKDAVRTLSSGGGVTIYYIRKTATTKLVQVQVMCE